MRVCMYVCMYHQSEAVYVCVSVCMVCTMKEKQCTAGGRAAKALRLPQLWLCMYVRMYAKAMHLPQLRRLQRVLY